MNNICGCWYGSCVPSEVNWKGQWASSWVHIAYSIRQKYWPRAALICFCVFSKTMNENIMVALAQDQQGPPCRTAYDSCRKSMLTEFGESLDQKGQRRRGGWERKEAICRSYATAHACNGMRIRVGRYAHGVHSMKRTVYKIVASLRW